MLALWAVLVSHWRASLVLVALLVSCGGGAWLGYRVARPVPKPIPAASPAVVQAKATAKQIDTLWLASKATLGVSIAKRDSMQHTLDSALAQLDSATRAHVAPLLLDVKHATASCDSLSAACQAFRDTTVRLLAADSTVQAAQEHENDSLRTVTATATSNTHSRTVWAAVGAGAVAVLHLIFHH